VEQFRELPNIISVFRARNIDYVLMKGIALSVLAYPDPLLRPMQDIDVMVRAKDVWRAQKALYQAGYRHGVFNPQDGRFTHLFRTITSRSLQFKHALHSLTKVIVRPTPVPPEQIPYSWRKRQIKSFSNADGTILLPIFLDVHFNLSVGLDVADVWRGVAERSVLGHLVPVQSPTTILWFTCARLYSEAFQHCTLKLQMFGDVDALLRRFQNEIDWAELLLIGNKYELTPALFYVLEQARRLLGSPVPERVTSLLKPNSLGIPLANDWGDVIPRLLSRSVIADFRFSQPGHLKEA
jgi:hypothetical protein